MAYSHFLSGKYEDGYFYRCTGLVTQPSEEEEVEEEALERHR
jgi:hypothetical protein